MAESIRALIWMALVMGVVNITAIHWLESVNDFLDLHRVAWKLSDKICMLIVCRNLSSDLRY